MSSITITQASSVYAVTGPSIRTAHRPGLSAMVIFATDVFGLSLVLWTFFGNTAIGRYTTPSGWLVMWPFLPLVLVLYAFFDLYPGVNVNPIDEIRSVSLANASAFLFIAVILTLHHLAELPIIVCLSAFISASVSILLMRALARNFGSRFAWWGYPVVLFGGGDIARSLLSKLKCKRHLGLDPVAIVANQIYEKDLDSVAVYKLSDVGRIASSGVKHAIVAAPELSHSDFAEVVARGGGAFPHLIIIPDTDSIWKIGSYTRDLTGLLGLQVRNNLLDSGSRVAKRVIDLACATTLIFSMLPLLIAISLAVLIESGFPVFYFDERVGRGGKTFHMWKFRTMALNSRVILEHHLANSSELQKEWDQYQKLRDDPRVTRVGRYLRRASLDELPQLWNVIKGEMSLVGPRPIFEFQLAKYPAAYSEYASTTPGITGLWQVSGRNRTTLKQRIAHDVYYVRNWSVWMDIYLLAKTVGAVLTRDGAY